MRKKPAFRKPNDRQVIALAQFRTSAGPMRDKHRDPKSRRMRARLEEKNASHRPDES